MRQRTLGMAGAALVVAGIALGIGTGLVADNTSPARNQAPLTVDGRAGPHQGPFIGSPNRVGPGGDRHRPDRRR